MRFKGIRETLRDLSVPRSETIASAAETIGPPATLIDTPSGREEPFASRPLIFTILLGSKLVTTTIFFELLLQRTKFLQKDAPSVASPNLNFIRVHSTGNGILRFLNTGLVRPAQTE